MKTESGVMLSLTHDQALVLFEWLSREDGVVSLRMCESEVRGG